MTSDTIENADSRKTLIKQGILLVLAPMTSVFLLATLSSAFSRPNPWPIKSLIAIVLIAGTFSGPLGLKRINRGRAGRYDGLGIICLGLVLGGTLFYLFFLFLAGLLYGISFYGLVPFGGR